MKGGGDGPGVGAAVGARGQQREPGRRLPVPHAGAAGSGMPAEVDAVTGQPFCFDPWTLTTQGGVDEPERGPGPTRAWEHTGGSRRDPFLCEQHPTVPVVPPQPVPAVGRACSLLMRLATYFHRPDTPASRHGKDQLVRERRPTAAPSRSPLPPEAPNPSRLRCATPGARNPRGNTRRWWAHNLADMWVGLGRRRERSRGSCSYRPRPLAVRPGRARGRSVVDGGEVEVPGWFGQVEGGRRMARWPGVAGGGLGALGDGAAGGGSASQHSWMWPRIRSSRRWRTGRSSRLDFMSCQPASTVRSCV